MSNVTGLPSFLKVNNNLLFVYIIFSLCVDRQGCLYILAIVNNIAMNMRMQIALCNPDFSSFREVPKSETTVGSQLDHSVSILIFLRNFYIDFHSTYIILLEKEMATHSSILGWRIPQTKETSGATVHGVTESDKTK